MNSPPTLLARAVAAVALLPGLLTASGVDPTRIAATPERAVWSGWSPVGADHALLAVPRAARHRHVEASAAPLTVVGVSRAVPRAARSRELPDVRHMPDIAPSAAPTTPRADRVR